MGAAAGAAAYAAGLPGGPDARAAALLLPGLVLALVLTHGMVSADVRGGAFGLWIQKPGRPAGTYAARLAAVAGLVVVGHALAAGGLVAWGGGGTGPTAGRIWALVATDLSLVALGFAVSTLGLRGDAALTLGVLVVLGGVGVDAAVAPERFGAWAPWLAAPRLPALEIHAVSLWLDGAGPFPAAGTWVRVVLHPLLTVGVGLALVERRGGGLRRRRGRRVRRPARAHLRRAAPPRPG